MIYISLSVISIKNTDVFFTKALGIFDCIGGDRLVCNSGVDFIIDLYQIGTLRHRNIFGIDVHAPSCFALHHGDDTKIKILSRLKFQGVEYELEKNIAGEFLNIKDPTGNRISIWTNHGGIK